MEKWLGVMNSKVMKIKTQVANKHLLNLSINQGNAAYRVTKDHSSVSLLLSSMCGVWEEKHSYQGCRNAGDLTMPGKAEDACTPVVQQVSQRHSHLNGDLPRDAQFSTKMSQGKSGSNLNILQWRKE